MISNNLEFSNMGVYSQELLHIKTNTIWIWCSDTIELTLDNEIYIKFQEKDNVDSNMFFYLRDNIV
jgi:hypothetical protein